MKKKHLIHKKIIVKKSPTHGYGVFAGKAFKKGEIMEQCCIIVSKGGDKKLEDYYFDANGKYAILTGYGMIYNHSDDPNAEYTLNLKTRVATIRADKTIPKGSEIYISYGEQWFRDREDLKQKAHTKVTK